ncbi:FtsK/SpoIIIE domain-containing protein [Streptomyces sp. A 4/2]|uniref:FtsK/SpoIIIE domain-containing protein n=1 Tax=Streptomyces sp. A 4/2 TaxID=2934314 RepID=UPI002024B575|nr:FtsK/SpoIIIE domain-containing protein [Streptomyces sp. A 4/2]
MRVTVTVVQQGAEERDVLLAVDDNTTAADVATALHPASAVAAGRSVVPLFPGTAGRPGSLNLWADGNRCDPAMPAAEFLRDGMRVSIDDTVGPNLRKGEPTGRYELRVTGGPGAGRVARLSLGTSTVGSGHTCTVSVPDSRMPVTALTVSVNATGEVRFAPHPGVSVMLDGAQVEGEHSWTVGALIKIGSTLLTLDEPVQPDAHLSPMGEGGLAYNRPPRLSSLPARSRLVVPQPPAKGEGARFQLIASLTPAVFGLVMYFVMGRQVYMLLFCLMTPIMMVGQWASESREGKKKHRNSMKAYKKEKAEHDEELERLSAADQRARRDAHPDAAQILLFATGPRRRLWERRITDPDALLLRVGVADLPADIELVQGKGADHDADPPVPPQVADVPVTLPVNEIGVVGLAGPRSRALTTASWLAAQAAVLHSPRDLSMVVLSSAPDADQAWNWAHWLPHAAPQLGQDCVALVGADHDTVARRVNELLTELNRRKGAKANGGFGKPLRPDPFVLLILDGARLLRRIPGVPQLLQEGPLYGMFALCLDEDERLLPEECRVAICWPPGSEDHLYLRGGGTEAIGDVLADQVSPAWCQLVARSLAPVRDVSRDDADSMLPTSARLLSLLSMPDPTGVDIARIWMADGSTTRVPIGLGAEGPFYLDIRSDGPHALVAGTTGAGKSELLQTIITSLAVANTPEALNFVLIDYKGGSAFQDCARLPHTVGMVSDLDAHLTERALASLAAELHRRETILFNAATKDIEDYNDTRKLQPSLEPMPRLVLIIDEFASLVAELPDFVAGLVDIARRGRSLGVHLILATQRPAGVVSADIRANTNLRIALRVTDASESQDVIDAPDSGAIAKSTPGRCYVRSGAQSLIGVQTARIGGRRPGTSTEAQISAIPLVWTAVGRPVPRASADGDDDGTLTTDLAVLVDAISEGAEKLGLDKPRSPWLPPLPDLAVVDEMPRPAPPTHGDVPPAVFGVTDVPSQQARAPLALDLVDGENLLLIGGPRSGRSTALRTIAASLASTTSPSDVHIYGVDCGNNALLPLSSLPHCGAIVTREQVDRLSRLLGRIHAEVSRRQQFLALQGVSSAAEQRATCSDSGDRLPWMVLLLDGWEGYKDAFESYDYGKLVESMVRLFREGASVGLRVVMTADRSGFSGMVASSFGDRLVMRLADPNDYSSGGLAVRDVPKDMPSGRALRSAEDGVQESQIALLAPEPSGQAQVQVLQRIGREATAAHGRPPRHLRPMRVDALPMRVTAREVLALDEDFAPPSRMWALLGVGGDELAPMGVDLAESGPGFVIAGPPKSGRSTTLVLATRSLLRSGLPVVLVTPKRSPLRDLDGEPGVLGVLQAGASGEELQELLVGANGGQFVVAVDDAELLHDTPLGEALEEIVRSGVDGEHALIAAGAADTMSSQYRGFLVESRRSRNGLLLAPTGSEGELFSIRLPRTAGGGPIGRGLLVSAGETTPIQVAAEG